MLEFFLVFLIVFMPILRVSPIWAKQTAEGFKSNFVNKPINPEYPSPVPESPSDTLDQDLLLYTIVNHIKKDVISFEKFHFKTINNRRILSVIVITFDQNSDKWTDPIEKLNVTIDINSRDHNNWKILSIVPVQNSYVSPIPESSVAKFQNQYLRNRSLISVDDDVKIINRGVVGEYNAIPNNQDRLDSCTPRLSEFNLNAVKQRAVGCNRDETHRFHNLAARRQWDKNGVDTVPCVGDARFCKLSPYAFRQPSITPVDREQKSQGYDWLFHYDRREPAIRY